MRRRLDLAISLLTRPPVLFLDEPTTGLDPRSRVALWDLVHGLVRDGTTVLLTTQYLEEADRLADTIAVIDGGRIVARGTAAELKEKVAARRRSTVLRRLRDARRAAAACSGRASAAGRQRRGRPPISTNADRAGARMVLEQPSLDEVFLALTSR